ncbi:hypothetical protein BHE87_19550 [Shigella sp. FC1708]|nr:hypothetical protein BHE87_19550 [Shigella sp. FC1708]
MLQFPKRRYGHHERRPTAGQSLFYRCPLLDRNGDIIGMDFTGHQHILAQDVIQRFQQFSN